jgi:thioredoxin reductase
MSNRFNVAIVGAGPAGLSCAARASELGASHVLLEASSRPAHTIYRYQKGKHVMAEPGVLPLRSALPFAAGKRENILGQWYADIRKLGINLRLNAPMVALSGQRGAFEITAADGRTFEAEHVVLAIGTQGNLRKLNIAGAQLERVQYQLDDPDAYSNETIAVIGAGDSAVENALALARNNRVVIVNRGDEFARCMQSNEDAVREAIESGRIQCYYDTRPVRIDPQTRGKPLALLVQTPQGQESIACDRVIARLGATPPRQLVESFGVRFSSAERKPLRCSQPGMSRASPAFMCSACWAARRSSSRRSIKATRRSSTFSGAISSLPMSRSSRPSSQPQKLRRP